MLYLCVYFIFAHLCTNKYWCYYNIFLFLYDTQFFPLVTYVLLMQLVLFINIIIWTQHGYPLVNAHLIFSRFHAVSLGPISFGRETRKKPHVAKAQQVSGFLVWLVRHVPTTFHRTSNFFKILNYGK